MSTQTPRFAFIDAVHAAEMVGVSPDVILDWVEQGKLKTFGGRPGNPFVRSGDVTGLAEELGVAAGEDVGRRVKSPSARVQARLTADARWADVSDADITEWAHRADKTRRQAARKVVDLTRARLETLLLALNDES